MPERKFTVRVRMYRPGLGDCFLLTFPRLDGEFHMLIDCGVVLGTQNPSERMQAIVEDIRQTTGGRLDLVLVTHEHWDHVSGFIQAQEVFDQIKIDEIWLAWTEDPGNRLAQELRRSRDERRKALRVALERMPPQFSEYRQGIEELLNFFGASQPDGALAGEPSAEELLGASGRSDTRRALDLLLERKDARMRYLTPGQPPLRLGGVDAARIFVLGPPTDVALLKKSDPSRRAKEVYTGVSGVTLADSFFAAVLHGLPANRFQEIEDSCFPFNAFYQVSAQEACEAERDPFFLNHYGFGEQGGEAWRRIDDDWLSMAGELALALDNDTNNTSLALAIELVESGRVLLFAADAQVGNWLSWKSLEWALPLGQSEVEIVTGKDLLNRTVLYKVGHHGSHNATLRQDGLELMESPDLIAMIPVHEEMARKKRWTMPFPALFKRLEEKTRGRILRVDEGLPPRKRLPDLSETEWQQFRTSTSQTDLYLEWFLSEDSS